VHRLAPILWVEDGPHKCLLLCVVCIRRPPDAHSPGWKRVFVTLRLPDGAIRDLFDRALAPDEDLLLLWRLALAIRLAPFRLRCWAPIAPVDLNLPPDQRLVEWWCLWWLSVADSVQLTTRLLSLAFALRRCEQLLL
jgi:hypothetical protein